MSSGAVLAIARAEVRRHPVTLLVLGVAAGLVGGLLTAVAMLAVRTATAPDRLFDAAAVGDASARVFGDPGLADAIEALPLVTAMSRNTVTIGRIENIGAVQYVGVTSPVAGGPLVDPVVTAGRTADPTRADEVMISEEISAVSGFGAGDRLELALLTPEEVNQFDTGFGEPDGPDLSLTITGVIRMPPGVLDGTPVVGTPALAAAHPDVVTGLDLLVSLDGGTQALPAFRAAVGELAGAPVDDSDFPPAIVSTTREDTDALIRSSHVLVGGFVVALVVGGIGALLALAQAWGRHHQATSRSQQIERALGLPTRERIAARLVPAAIAATVAGAVAAAIAVGSGVLEPAGALRRVEPHPGWRVDVTTVLVGVGATVLCVLASAAATAWSAGRRRERLTARRPRDTTVLAPRRGGWPLLGAVFALSGRGERGAAPMRTALVGATVAVAGVVGAATFAASLDRLTSTPERYGWTGDLEVADINDDVMAELVADARFEAIADVTSMSVTVGDTLVDGYAYTPVRGDVAWVLHEGRLPADDDEVVLGSHLADDLGLGVGDAVAVGGRDLRVVGRGIGPNVNGEVLGDALLVTPEGLAASAPIGSFREAMLRVAPGHDARAIAEELAVRYEVYAREMPIEVRNLADLGSLPELLGGFLAILGMTAVLHALVVTVRLRAGDLGVLGALGATRRQMRLTLVMTSVVTAVVGIVVGVPLGWAAARFVWSGLARSIGVADDVATTGAVVVVPLAALAVAVLLALLPASRIRGIVGSVRDQDVGTPP